MFSQGDLPMSVWFNSRKSLQSAAPGFFPQQSGLAETRGVQCTVATVAAVRRSGCTVCLLRRHSANNKNNNIKPQEPQK
eukprot:10958168-Heterocapsa_arctica.AAC.1